MTECKDTVLKEHLEAAGRNATYISSVAQNELIKAIAKANSIIAEVKDARFFSLLADETTDFSRQEQLTVCLRYLQLNGGICERFLCFAVAPDLTGLGLANQLLAIIEEAGLDIKNLVGQGYDGAAAMSGDKN